MVRSKLMASFWLCLALVIACDAVTFADETVEVSAADSKPQVLYLHTVFLPYKMAVDKPTTHRLGREIVRQAVLLTARDEMGLATCDETLNETPPEDASVVEVLLVERADLHGKWNVKIVGYDSDGDPWEKTYDYKADSRTMYAEMIPKLEVDTRGVFREALELAGLEGEKPKSGESEAAGEEIETMLRQVDFVAQFAAVRAAHHAIATHGETPEWLGVLVRGYANLAVLTRHHWSTATEVFTARSWLYAQRMMVTTQEDDLARWHRAYAWALGGTLHHALADLEKLKSPGQEDGQSDNTDNVPEASPPWTKLIKPYCMCDRDATKQVGEQDASLKPWATRLWFQLTSAYRVAPWIHHAGEEIAGVAPTAYGVYAEMVNYGGSLGTTRIGAAWGPKMFAQYVPKSLSKISGLPKSVEQVIAGNALNGGFFGGLFGSTASTAAFSPIPMLVAKQLRKEAEQESQPDLSWSALAFLLEEEQFVQIANDLITSTNAVEYSLADAVDAVLPLVEDHRYAAYIESFRYNERREPEKLQETMGGLKFEDPRMNSVLMFFRTWYIEDAGGHGIGGKAYQNAQRNLTMPGILEYSFYRSSGSQTDTEQNLKEIAAAEFLAIAPHSDIGVRMDVHATQEPTSDQLKKWEDQLREDPNTFIALARHYKSIGDLDGSVRCYEKSLGLISTIGATSSLAEIYLDQRNYTKWEETLLNYLDSENHGLEHASIHRRMAYGYAARGKWRKAKSHALTAAQTAAAWGMHVASHVSEGLSDWDESEHYIRSMSESYSSTAGFLWHFWCRRNGRGDIESAKRLAEQYFAAPSVASNRYLGAPIASPTRGTFMILGAYQLLEGNTAGCLKAYRKALSFQPEFTCAFMVAQLERELGNEPERMEVLDAIEEFAIKEKPSAKPDRVKVLAAGLAVLQLMKSADTSKASLANIDDCLCEVDEDTRCAFVYYVAKELDNLEVPVEAEKYWRRGLVIASRDVVHTTLSGMELAKRHGTSRPDDDVLDEDDLWPSLPADPNDGAKEEEIENDAATE